MSDARRVATIEAICAETARLHIETGRSAAGALVAVADAIAASLEAGGKVLLCGNGGSAADAQHCAAELVGRFQRERQGLAAVALTTDTSILTAVANDYGYDRVFARQIEALGRPGDLVIGISTSGASENVLAAFSAARSLGMTTIALTGGDGGRAGRAADMHLNVPSQVTARVQEVHRTMLHVICELVEETLAGRQGA